MTKKGYTLIEIIIAVTILALVIVPIGTLLTQSVYSNIKSNEMMTALAIAQDKIEELKSLSFSEIKAKLGEKHENTVKYNDYSFQRNVKIQKEDTNLLKITVNVQWDNGVLNIATYRGKY